MIVSEEEALERVNSPENLTYKLRALHINRTGPKNIPPMITALAVTTSLTDGQKEAGKTFGMSQQNVSHIKNHGKNEEVQSLIKKTTDEIHEKALDGMLSCITHISEKIPNVKKATELSAIAANLAKVVEKTQPKDSGPRTAVQIIVHQPRSKEEFEYEEVAV